MTQSRDIVIITSFMGKYSNNKDKFVLELGEKIVPSLNDLGFENIAIEHVFPNRCFMYPNFKVLFNEIAPKGECVDESLRYSIKIHNPRFIIHIDGSEKIPKEYIIDIAKEFINGNVDAVLAKREGEKAVSDERWAKEKFELFLLEEKYNIPELPDGQCGLWGFRLFPDVERRINITCKGYEVELDLVSEILGKKLNHKFIPIKVMNPEKITGYQKEDDISKLIFISEKESLKKHHILASMKKFHDEKLKLPKDYMEKIEEWAQQ